MATSEMQAEAPFLLTVRGTQRWPCPGVRGQMGRFAEVRGFLCSLQGLALSLLGRAPEQFSQGAGNSPQGQACLKTALTSGVSVQEKRGIVQRVGVGRAAGATLAGSPWPGAFPAPQRGWDTVIRGCTPGRWSLFILRGHLPGVTARLPRSSCSAAAGFVFVSPVLGAASAPCPGYGDEWERRQRLVLVLIPALRE